MGKKLILKNVKAYTMSSLGVLGRASIIVEGKVVSEVREVGGDVVGGEVEVLDCEGLTAFPGFVDPHTHLGVQRLEWSPDDQPVETTDPLTPHLRVLDAIDPYDPGFKDAIRGGVTTVVVHPGSYMSFGKIVERITIIPGQSAVLKTNGRVLVENAGVKIAVGEHPKRFLEEQKLTPTTRMGILAAVRAMLVKAREYSEKKSREGGKFQRDLKLEALEMLLKNEVPARIHAHTSRDILSAIRVLEDFGVNRIIIEHGTESCKISGVLREKGIPVVLGPIVFSRRGVELKELSSKLPVCLWRSGVKFALTTDHPTIPIEYLTLIAGAAVGEGLPYEEALRSITINAAEIAGVSENVGSIEPGKDADIVVFDGDPLDPRSRVVYTIIDGELVYERGG